MELDPRSALLITESAWPHGYLGRHDEGLEIYKKALEIDPNLALTHFDVAWSYQRKGMYDQARDSYLRALELSGRASLGLCWYSTLLAETGEVEEARLLLEEMKERQRNGEKISAFVAMVYDALGERETAFAWLDRSFEDREPTLGWIGISPELGFRNIRSEDRFTDLFLRVRGKEAT